MAVNILDFVHRDVRTEFIKALERRFQREPDDETDDALFNRYVDTQIVQQMVMQDRRNNVEVPEPTDWREP